MDGDAKLSETADATRVVILRLIASFRFAMRRIRRTTFHYLMSR